MPPPAVVPSMRPLGAHSRVSVTVHQPKKPSSQHTMSCVPCARTRDALGGVEAKREGQRLVVVDPDRDAFLADNARRLRPGRKGFRHDAGRAICRRLGSTTTSANHGRGRAAGPTNRPGEIAAGSGAASRRRRLPQRLIHAALGSDSGPPTTLVEWQKKHVPDDPNLVRLDATLADLATWGTREDCDRIESKAQAAREEVAELRRRQLVDSVQFEITDLKRKHHEQLVARARLRAVEARLAQLAQPEAAEFIAQLTAITASSDPTQMLPRQRRLRHGAIKRRSLKRRTLGARPFSTR